MAAIKIEVQPWQTPNFVSGVMPVRPRQEGFTEAPKWQLSEVDPMVLSELCDMFRAEIFKKAGKRDPR